MSERSSLVLLHGWGFDKRIWENIIPALNKSFDVIDIDLPCFGNNSFCSSNIDEVAIDLLKHLPQKCIFMGWSLGGMIATHIAIHYPQRVTALITIGSNLKWVAVDTKDEQWPGASADNFASFFENLSLNFESTKQHFCSVIARGDQDEKNQIKVLRKHLSTADAENFLAGLRLLDSIDNRACFVSLAIPGLHLFGENDVLVPLEVERRIKSTNKKQKTKILSGLAHAPFLSEPDLFVNIISDYIKNIGYQIDKKQIAESFSKAARTYDGSAQLQRDIGDRLFSMIPEKKINTLVDLGSGTGVYSDQLQQKFPQGQLINLDIAIGMLQAARRKTSICADAEYLPFKNNSIDLVFSNLAIQWCQNYQQLFAELYRVLAPDGHCVISTFTEGTLSELKLAWQSVDDAAHVNKFACAKSLQELARQAGFCSIDVQRQSLVRHYATVKELTCELKTIGAHNINSGRPEGLTGKNKLKKLIDAYERFRCDDKIPAHYEIVFLILKKE